jgi:hypothetical protein
MNRAFGEAALPAEAEQVLRKFLRRNVELYDQSGRALSPPAQSDAPGCAGAEEFLKTILVG